MSEAEKSGISQRHLAQQETGQGNISIGLLLRGAGKSTLGARLAPLLNTPFLKLNHEIEQSSGMPVNEVIALYGQEGYRLLEHQAIERIVATHDALVLAVAGGITAQADTFNYLLDHYHTVWLRAAPDDHMNRVRAQGDERPMAGNPNAMKELRRILASREKQYDRADAQVDTTNATEDQSLSELRNTIRANGFIQD